MSGNIIHVAAGQEPSGRAWVVVRQVGDHYRVTVDDPRNPNPVTLSERLDSFWTALLEARTRAKSLGVPVHAVGCEHAQRPTRHDPPVHPAHQPFSKKFENHVHALVLCFMFFVRIHKRLRMTPVTPTGPSSTFWTIDDIATQIDARTAKPAKRGPYKKRNA